MTCTGIGVAEVIAACVGAELRRWFGHDSSCFEEFSSEVYEYIDADPYVICDTRYGTGRESNVPIDAREADVFEFRDGKIIRVTLGYAATATALEATGSRA